MADRIVVLILAALLLPLLAAGQQPACSLRLSGQVIDTYTAEPLPYASVWVEETGGGTETDEEGHFVLTALCRGAVHLQISHIGCHTERLYLVLEKDTSLLITLSHNEAVLEGVVVTDERSRTAGQSQSSLSQQQLEAAAGRTLADIASRLAGVSVLRNGSGIAKPVIHGLSGNRIAILNNGLVQAGQQWGADHAPEIDPFTADRLTVVRGVDAIPYGGNTLGGAVLTESSTISVDPHLHGFAQYIGETNGRMQTVSTRLERGGGWADWRVTGTYKFSGDHRTPDYFLRNTGLREQALAGQLNRHRGQRYQQLYYSFFNTELGILRGAHIGNLTDLEAAIGRETPFFTEPSFSSRLEAPRQVVTHHLLKYNYKHYYSEDRSFQLTYGGQLNHRREYDVRRGGRSDRPALDLLLQAHFVDMHWQQERPTGRNWKAGIQLRFLDNDNQAGTGILPLVPDYQVYQPSAYGLLHGKKGKLAWQTGGRYDFFALDAQVVSTELPRRLERFYHRFHNITLAGGLEYPLLKGWNTKVNVGLVQRAPEANELHSAGLHQGVAGIEEGNPSMQQERSAKVVWTHTLSFRKKWLLESSLYHQYIVDYIFLEPQAERRLTIRGAFPLFLYKQTDASLSGLDFSGRFLPSDHWEFELRYAVVRGRDLGGNQPLYGMPADRLSADATYTFGRWRSFSNNRITLSSTYAFEQTRLLPAQDFLPPPPGYFLLSLNLATDTRIAGHTLHIYLLVDNALNVRYRDFLNRLRYYADEQGRNLRLNLKWEF